MRHPLRFTYHGEPLWISPYAIIAVYPNAAGGTFIRLADMTSQVVDELPEEVVAAIKQEIDNDDERTVAMSRRVRLPVNTP